ncbi:MAG: hypothetical protein Q8L78_02610 [Coxiellaceae bacterium]|nr:hypothetical protein [Coxiellaceae bacterium]
MRKIVLCLFASSYVLSFSNAIYANDEITDAANMKVTALIKPNKSFFIGAGAGMNWLLYGQTTNTLYYTPYPYVDPYINDHSSTAGSITADFGYRWASDITYSVGLRYEHILSSKVNGSLLVLNNPTFPYNFSSNTSSNVLLLFGKFDLSRIWRISPYGRIGLGMASNSFEDYSEAPANNATPRNVSFGSNSNIGFAYDLGFGLDYAFKQHYILSVGYDYESLGTLKSGNGSYNYVTNANNQLNFGKLTANKVIAELNYIFK